MYSTVQYMYSAEISLFDRIKETLAYKHVFSPVIVFHLLLSQSSDTFASKGLIQM